MARRLEWHFQIENNYGYVWDLQNLSRITGIALPPANRASQRTPTQHGSEDLGYRVEDREVVIGAVLVPLYGGDEDCQLDARQRSVYRVLGYGLGPMTLKAGLLRKPGVRRELRRCEYGGGVEGDSEIRHENGELLAFRLIGRDPMFYDPDSHSITSVYGDFSHGLYTSTLTLDSADGLTTLGDWYASPTIAITGPCTSFDLQSDTTGQRLRFNGAVADGEVVTIETNPKLVTATSTVNGDVRDGIPPSDDFGEFVLWHHPHATDGDNEWSLEVAGSDANSQFVFTWEDRYQGI